MFRMRTPYILLAIILTFLSLPLNASNFNGKVVNSNGKPLRNIVVINKTNSDADYTNEEGFFTIEAQIGDSLQISDILYQSNVVIKSGINEFILEERSVFDERIITDSVVDKVNTLFLSEKYKTCIAYCMYYIPKFNVETESRHPYKECVEHTRFLYKTTPFSIAKLAYLGAISAYQYSLQHTDATVIFSGFEWSKISVALFEDFIKLFPPGYYEPWHNMDYYIKELALYVDSAEWAINAIACGAHFLKALEDDKWVRKQEKWFMNKYSSLYKTLYNNTKDVYKDEFDQPFLEYKISKISVDYKILSNKAKDINVAISKYFDSIVHLIHKSPEGNTLFVHTALSTIKNFICSLLIEPDISDMDQNLALEILVKLQDLSYSKAGSSRYTTDVDYTIEDIKSRLKINECAILHFEALVSSGSLYYRYDLGTRYRNYALVITSKQKNPEIWHRGYISNVKVNDLTKIKESYPEIDKYYLVGTPRMSFLDFAGKDSSIVLLHSLSQLLDKKEKDVYKSAEVTFIGDINYTTVADLSFLSINKGGDHFNRLLGPANELKTICDLFEHVRLLRGNDAKRNVVGSEICRSNSIVHISTHGITTSQIDDVVEPEALALKENILQNSRLILSGYNDNPNSTLCSMTARDVLELKKTDAQIIFLDACLSGAGGVGSAGAVGLAEAFHLIGANNVICYLEPVMDNVATMFSNCFYRELSKGHSCHDAFYKAKNEVDADIKVVLWE